MGFSPERLFAILAEWPRPARYWVAYSGGLDSSVLLHALAALRDRLAVPLAALHLDHGLQAPSADWVQHCRQVCAGLDVPLRVQSLGLREQPGTSLEALARDARRAAFATLLGEGEMMLTAHHQDDQAETFWLQLLRGSGLRGLSAMPRLQPLAAGFLARPLLEFSRAELREQARLQGIAWIQDPSNEDCRFDRNFLRQRLLPLVAERWPAQARTSARAASHCAEAQGLIDALAQADLEQARGRVPHTLSVARLRALAPDRARALLRFWIRALGLPVPASRPLARILTELLPAAPDRQPLVAWPGAEARRYRDQLYVLKPLPARPQGPLPWPKPEALRLPAGLGWLHPPAPWPGDGLWVGFRAGGEQFCPPGQTQHRSLKNLCQEAGVPDWLRPYLPLVHRDRQLLAVAGLGFANPALGVRWAGHPWTGLLDGEPRWSP